MNKFALINLLHIFIFGGLFIYIFVKNEKMPQFMYSVLIILGIIIVQIIST